MSVETAGLRLQQAAATHTPCGPVRDLLTGPDLDAAVALAYDVQQAVVAARLRAGARVIGRKIGLTNPKVQAQLGVDQPDFGVLLDDMLCLPEEPVDHTRLLQPRIEAEIAFVLNDDLDLAGEITVQDVLAATDHLVPALEIVDSRIAGWDITIVDTIADNGSSGLFVLGEAGVSPTGLDLVDVTMSMTRSGEVVSEGVGADCLGDPLLAVAWLASTARDHGAPLRAGDLILSGALGPMVPVTPGDTFVADLSGLGTVTAEFTS